jgi:hypothetical protein
MVSIVEKKKKVTIADVFFFSVGVTERKRRWQQLLSVPFSRWVLLKKEGDC